MKSTHTELNSLRLTFPMVSRVEVVITFIKFLMNIFWLGIATPIVAYLYLPVFYKLNATSAYEVQFQEHLLIALINTLLIFLISTCKRDLEKPRGWWRRYLTQYKWLCTWGLCCMHQDWHSKLWRALIKAGRSSWWELCACFTQRSVEWRPWSSLTFSNRFWCTVQCWRLLLVEQFMLVDSRKSSEQQAMATGWRFGSKSIWNILRQSSSSSFVFSFNPNPTVRHSWVSILIGSTATYLTLYAVSQGQVQRLLTVKDLKSAQLAVWLNWPILSFLSLSTSLSGLVIYYYYRKCDPLEQGRINSRDQNMPLYVIDGKTRSELIKFFLPWHLFSSWSSFWAVRFVRGWNILRRVVKC